MIFCCCNIILFEESIFGIPLTINWRCVVNVVADINAISRTVTIFTVPLVVPKKVSEIGAPKNSAWAADAASEEVNTPFPSGGFFPIALRTVKSAKKIGACPLCEP